MKSGKISSQFILNHAARFEGKFYMNDNAHYSMILERNLDKCSKLSLFADVFNPPVFKRQFCTKTDRSIPYYQSGDVRTLLKSPQYVFKGQVESLGLIVNKGDLLITGFGTVIGDVCIASSIHDKACFANNVCRVIVNNESNKGYIYAVLASRFGRAQLNNNASGTAIRYIEAPRIKETLIPLFDICFQKKIEEMINESFNLREEATNMLDKAERILKEESGLSDLTTNDYDYFGPQLSNRKPSCYKKNIKDIGSKTFNAFNHSERVRTHILDVINSKPHISFSESLDANQLVSPGGVNVIEVKEQHGIMLINQSDIFDTIVKGKWVAKKTKYSKDLLKKGEILLAKIGTLGESETFCRCIYVNEDLEGHLVSSAFYRMKASNHITPGYLYTWLNSDYGFRLLRSTHFGTKLCYPNPDLFYNYPVPIISKKNMEIIDELVREAHTMKYKANCIEKNAIQMVEQEIEKWNK